MKKTMKSKKRNLVPPLLLAVLLALTSARGQEPCIHVNASQVTGSTSRYLTGVAVCDANHEVYGGLYSQMIYGEHFAEPAMEPLLKGFEMWSGGWRSKDGITEVGWTYNSFAGDSAQLGGATDQSLLLCKEPAPKGGVSAELMLNSEFSLGTNHPKSNNFGLLVRGCKRSNLQGGPKGLVVLLDTAKKEVQLGRFDLKELPCITILERAPINLPKSAWIQLSADWNETELTVSADGKPVLRRSGLSQATDGGDCWGLISPKGLGRFRNISSNGALVPIGPESDASKADQVSFHWRAVRKGNASGLFSLVKDRPLAAKQCQRMEFTGGQGAVGLSNEGSHRLGLKIVGGKPYEGVLFARSPKPVQLHVALESPDGLETYAEQELSLAAGDWQKLEFKLTPGKSDPAGRFVVLLKSPGIVDLGYAFLQPGEWGRYKGLPVRRDIVEEMLANGVSAIRFSAALAWLKDYNWKMAAGPRELRPPFVHCFYPYSSGGWSWLEFLDLCAAADIMPIPDFSMTEKPQDILDFIEYANGSAESEWGKRRAKNGHPAPFNIHHIQLGNEWQIDEGYWKLFEPLAEAVWARDPKMVIIVGGWAIDSETNPRAIFFQKMLQLAKKHQAEVWFDHHLNTNYPAESRQVGTVVKFVQTLRKLGDGAKFKVVVLELNAITHNMMRALATAQTLGTLSEVGEDVPLVCGSNALESDLYCDNGWSQGLVFLNSQKAWSQPPGYVMRMISSSRLPLRVKSEVTGINETLFTTAETDEARKKLTVRVVNSKPQPVSAKITLNGFDPSEPVAQVSELSGPINAFNRADKPDAIAPRLSPWKHTMKDGSTTHVFPPNSFTVIQFNR